MAYFVPATALALLSVTLLAPIAAAGEPSAGPTETTLAAWHAYACAQDGIAFDAPCGVAAGSYGMLAWCAEPLELGQNLLRYALQRAGAAADGAAGGMVCGGLGEEAYGGARMVDGTLP